MVEEDVSRRTLFVLVVLSLLISLLGTWTVLSQVTGMAVPARSAETGASGGATGQVGLVILEQRPSSASSGQASLTILDNP